MLTCCYPRLGALPASTASEQYRGSPQFDDGVFHNTVATSVMASGASSWINMLEFFFADNGRVPDGPVPVDALAGNFGKSADYGLRVVWLGHSTVLMEMNGTVILTDPILGGRASPVPFAGPKRFPVTRAITADDLPDVIDAVVISHDHYDHLDYDTIVALKNRVGCFFVPLGVGAHLERWGVERGRIIELDWWHGSEYRGVTFTATPARHFSGRGISRNRTLWCSWIIAGKERRVFFSGDSGYSEDFGKIGDKYGPFDLTLMECGAYNESWPNVHMMPEDTVRAHIDLGGGVLVPVHWAQFNLSLHSWTEPVERLLAAAAENGVVCVTPQIGSVLDLPGDYPENKWWNTVSSAFR